MPGRLARHNADQAGTRSKASIDTKLYRRIDPVGDVGPIFPGKLPTRAGLDRVFKLPGRFAHVSHHSRPCGIRLTAGVSSNRRKPTSCGSAGRRTRVRRPLDLDVIPSDEPVDLTEYTNTCILSH